MGVGMMERDGLGLMAGSAGARHVRLARWLERKCASERENIGGASEDETVWGVPETRAASPTEEGQDT